MRASWLVLILALGLVAGCKDCDDNPVGPSGPTMSLSLNTDTLRLEVGSTAAVTATTEGADQVAWSSPNPAIVSLSVSGKSATVMAVSAGIGRVIARLQADQNKVDTVIVVVSAKPVVPQVRGITMSGGAIQATVGQVFLRDVTVTADADSLKGFKCNSSNPAVVSVVTLTGEKQCRFTVFGSGTAEVWAETLYAGTHHNGTTDRFRSGFLVTATVAGGTLVETPSDVPVEVPLGPE